MGIQQHFSIGPYIIAKHKKVDVEEVKHICKTPNCSRKDKEIKSNFCAECGHKPESISTFKKDNYSISRLFFDNGYEDYFYFPHNGGEQIYNDQDILLPNKNYGRVIQIDFYDFTGEIALSKINFEEDMNKFKEFFKGAIDLMIENNFEISFEWGVVVSYS